MSLIGSRASAWAASSSLTLRLAVSSAFSLASFSWRALKNTCWAAWKRSHRASSWRRAVRPACFHSLIRSRKPREPRSQSVVVDSSSARLISASFLATTCLFFSSSSLKNWRRLRSRVLRAPEKRCHRASSVARSRRGPRCWAAFHSLRISRIRVMELRQWVLVGS